ncbi:MAG: hypothetical protein AB7F41_16395 [Methylocystis sp.]|uniref:hypothetical protein n=1 Tax=Methylocystis sp. TaxID=1911079 RepID=UPI003D09DCE8
MKHSGAGAVAAVLLTIAAGHASELENAVPPAPLIPGMLASKAAPTLRIGAYVGALSDQSLINITVLRPWAPNFASGILVDAHAVYTAYRFQSIPLELELEGGVAKRFGSREAGQQWEFDLIPMARWTYFPWNDFVYTNFRLGLIGASYVTGISDFERQFDSSGHSSRFLNLLVPELTVSPYKEAPFEVFVRVHHRSGVYGLINGVHGASNYISTGIRFTAF